MSGWREIRPRKTKYAFKADFGNDIIATATELNEALQGLKVHCSEYTFRTNVSNGNADMTLYTDNEVVRDYLKGTLIGS